MASTKFLLLACLFVVSALADSSTTRAARSKGVGPKKATLLKRPALTREKILLILNAYEGEAPLEEKNKKVDEIAASFTKEEKKIIDGYKKFFAQRAEKFSKLSDPTKAAVKEIRDLRKQQAAAYAKIDKKELQAAKYVLNASPFTVGPRPPFKKAIGKNGKRPKTTTASV